VALIFGALSLPKIYAEEFRDFNFIKVTQAGGFPCGELASRLARD
jgi:hypothetical protein